LYIIKQKNIAMPKKSTIPTTVEEVPQTEQITLASTPSKPKYPTIGFFE